MASSAFGARSKIPTLIILLGAVLPVLAYVLLNAIAGDQKKPGSTQPAAPISIQPVAPVSIPPVAPVAAQPIAPIPIEPAAPVSLQPGPPLTADELRAIMGVEVWKFDVWLPPTARRVVVSLEKRSQTGPPQPVGDPSRGDALEARVTPDTPRHLMIALTPIDGGNLSSGRVRIWIEGFDRFNSWQADTPIPSQGYLCLSEPERFPDGAFAILGGFARNHPGREPIIRNADTIIVVKIDARDN